MFGEVFNIVCGLVNILGLVLQVGAWLRRRRRGSVCPSCRHAGLIVARYGLVSCCPGCRRFHWFSVGAPAA